MPGLQAQDNSDNWNDDALVQSTLAGNTGAFGTLVERYQQRVIAICAHIAGDYDQAADLAQDAFVQAYTNLHRYQTGRSFFAWLYRIAVNTALNYRNRRPPSPVRGEEAESALQEAHDPGLTPEERAVQADLARRIQAGIAQLPTDYASILALRYGADLDYEEIAATLNMPLGTVKTRLFRAKAMLRPILERLREEDQQ